MSEPRIDRIIIVRMDEKVYARCYTGKNFTDAYISIGCLGNIVSDGAEILRDFAAAAAKDAPMGKPVDNAG